MTVLSIQGLGAVLSGALQILQVVSKEICGIHHASVGSTALCADDHRLSRIIQSSIATLRTVWLCGVTCSLLAEALDLWY